MKQIASILFSLLFMFVWLVPAKAVTPKSSQSKNVLVVYFSQPETNGTDASTGASRLIQNGKLYGTTEYMARLIGEATGGDLFELTTTHAYPQATHKELIDYAKQEAETKTYPKIAKPLPSLDKYDVVFVGYPNWWYDMPMVIYSLFNEYDFGGKTVIPFVTHGGSSFSQSVENIAGMEKHATVVRGPSVSRNGIPNMEQIVNKWLKDNGYIQ